MASVGAGFPGFEEYQGRFAPDAVAIAEGVLRAVLTIHGDSWWSPEYGTTFWESVKQMYSTSGIDHLKAEAQTGARYESDRATLESVEFIPSEDDPEAIECIITMKSNNRLVQGVITIPSG